jgi:hypothetical protein
MVLEKYILELASGKGKDPEPDPGGLGINLRIESRTLIFTTLILIWLLQ